MAVILSRKTPKKTNTQEMIINKVENMEKGILVLKNNINSTDSALLATMLGGN